MFKLFKKAFFCLTLFLVFFHLAFAQVSPGTILSDAEKKKRLQEAINQRSQELQTVTNHIKETQKNLEAVQNQGKSLQKEIQRLDLNAKKINLDIEASKINIEKLTLETDALGYSIDETENQIIEKNEYIAKLLQELNQSENETPLLIFLKNKSLAESVTEAQNISDLNQGLKDNIQGLKSTKVDLASQLKTKANKKKQVELETENFKNQKVILVSVKQDKQIFLAETKNKEQNYQKIISDLEKKQADIAVEIEKLEGDLRLKIDPTSLPKTGKGVLGMPVIGAPLSQDYGATSFAKYGYRGKWHNGVDFASPIGTPVYSAEKGKVISAGNQDLYCYRGAYGKFIVIEHENNLGTLYAHLSLQVVKEGDTVERGSLIGYVGRTGYATGPHLHFTVYASPTLRISGSKSCGPKMPFGGDLNPLNYL